ncbi:putative nucleoredoxin 1 [Symbiodinium microadriaticum]|uniref:protein-disulfide reductase n=1 Tax=Symbiodinium microadriaticum TaxID=2951 RepID=A0A1Q9EL69_SYMMI|nr:putative nucleoredoxin 1 [Symbiodinium microadriaticum]
MEALLGTTLLHGTAQVATSSLQGGVVALYFSAGWCPPCKGFTPQFRKVYERAKSKNRALDVVFVSSDRDETSFREYFAKMPWHALPFADRQRQQQLSASFGIRGIPAVVLLNSSGQLLDASARGKVMEPGFVLSLPRSIDLASAALPEPSGAMQLQLRYKGCEYDIECEPSEGWEMLRMQIYSMIDVPSEQLKLFGLGLDKGRHEHKGSAKVRFATGEAEVECDGHLDINRYTVWELGKRGIAAQKNSGLQLAKAELNPNLGLRQRLVLQARRLQSLVPVGPGRGADCGQWVTRFRVELADSEGVRWAKYSDLRVEKLGTSGKWHLFPFSEVALGNFSAGDPFESETPEVPMDAMMQEQHLVPGSLLERRREEMSGDDDVLRPSASFSHRSCLSRVEASEQVGSLATVQGYEMKSLQRQALDEIPVLGIDAAANPSESYEISFMRMCRA